jgi:hypothetical protein
LPASLPPKIWEPPERLHVILLYPWMYRQACGFWMRRILDVRDFLFDRKLEN